MIHIDHISLAARNLYEASYRLRDETLLGFYDGGWTQSGLASKVFPLGSGAYLHVEGITDVYAVNDQARPGLRQFLDSVALGEHFRGLSLRVDTLAELQEIAERHGTKIYKNASASRIRPDGTRIAVVQTPSISESWSQGMPNWVYFPELNIHPSAEPVDAYTNLVDPDGLAWIEMGGTESMMSQWLGTPAANFPFRFNGGVPGVHAIAINTEMGEVVLRRTPVNVVVGTS